jgi:hypothetical protein
MFWNEMLKRSFGPKEGQLARFSFEPHNDEHYEFQVDCIMENQIGGKASRTGISKIHQACFEVIGRWEYNCRQEHGAVYSGLHDFENLMEAAGVRIRNGEESVFSTLGMENVSGPTVLRALHPSINIFTSYSI